MGETGCATQVSELERRPAICVLGCRPGSAALARRARAARDVFFERDARLVVACGGGRYRGRLEADELVRMLEEAGVPRDALVREPTSRDTYENAMRAAQLLAPRFIREVVVVTCSWHLPRATRLFERAGLRVVGCVGAPPPRPTVLARLWWAVRERVALYKDLRR